MEDLFELADLVHAIGRHLPPPQSIRPGICTSVEMQVMRAISNNPGSSAQLISRAARLPSSNFARVLRNLETKGLVRRQRDSQDRRAVNLYLTGLAEENFVSMRIAWQQALDGIIEQPSEIDQVIRTLRRIEQALVERQK